MNKNNLKLIDFSRGIQDSDIKHNFNALLNQIEQERISVAGSGISYGLDFKLNGFELTITEGFLVDKEGRQIILDEEKIQIEKPILIHKEELGKTVDNANRIKLNEMPYALNRETTAENSADHGIVVTMSNMSGSSAIVPISSIDGNVLNLGFNNVSSNRKVNVSYNYALKRRDIIFIDKDYKIQYRVGISSPSPSIMLIDESECSYILGYVEVDSSTVRNGKVQATASVIKEFKSNRNVYTDEDNELYLCGTPFSSIKVIHTSEPSNPDIDTFWYDSRSNELKIWRRTDLYEFKNTFVFSSSDPDHNKVFNTDIKYLYNKSQLKVYLNGVLLNNDMVIEGPDLTELQKTEDLIYTSQFKITTQMKKGDLVSYIIDRYDGYEEWVSINNKNVTNYQERLIWTPERIENEVYSNEHDMQTFLFNFETERNLLFAPGTNSVEILIDQVPLHSDQFTEITISDAIAGDNYLELREKLSKYYGFNGDFDPEKFHDEFENTGIGFKLGAKLNDTTSYVEVRITQRVNSNPIAKRFQRTASYVEENSIIYEEYSTNEYNETSRNEPIFTTSAPFRYEENQIEVYLNRTRLERNIDFVEVAGEDDVKGSSINKIEIFESTGIKNGDRVSYRITASFYSYDHVDGLISGFTTRLEDMEDKVIDTLEKVNDKSEYIDRQIGIISGQLEELENFDEKMNEKFITKDSKITENNIPLNLLQGISAGAFYKIYSITDVPQSIDITGIFNSNDFVLIYNTSTGNILIRDSDYTIIEENGFTRLVVTTQSAKNCAIYATGIKFNRGLI